MNKDNMYTRRRAFSPYGIILLILLISSAFPAFAQGNLPVDTVSSPMTLPNISSDSTLSNDILPLDSISPEKNTSGISESISYDAQDSVVFDLVNGKVLLYGDAVVKYDGLEVKAAFIEYDFKESVACAAGISDSTGTLQGKPQLSDDGQNFTQEYMCYNFKTKEGFSKVSVTQDGDAIFHAGVSKRHENEWIHIRNGKFTTCDAENPHYHFHLRKAIIVPDEKVVSGPLIMKVRKVPTPLALPFGWFPTQNKQSHGIILPGYGNANSLGFFLKDGGYYFPIGRNWDTRILGDIYSRGSWGVRNITNYKKRYKYSGNFNVSRTVIKNGFKELPSFSKQTEFFLRWTHNQDPKARPNSRFSANVNLGSRNNFRNNLNSTQQDFLTNTFTSSIQYNQSFPGKPWSLGVSARQSQNSSSGNLDLTLPSITLNRNRTYLPLGTFTKNRVSQRKLDKLVAVTYSANFDNLLSTESSRVRFDNIGPLARSMKNGIRQTVSLNSQLKAKFVTITPNLTYNEYWNFKRLEVSRDPDTGLVQRDTIADFTTARDYRVSANATTRFYGVFNFRNAESVKAIRHVLTPSFGMSYTPFKDRNVYGFFGDDGELESYNPLSPGRFVAGNTRESWAVNGSFGNNLEMKVRDKSSERLAYKKVKLIENFAVSGNYNLIADSLNLSNISMRGFTTLFKKLRVNYNSSHSAYERNANGQNIDSYLAKRGRLLRMRNASVALSTSLRSSNKSKKEKDVPEEMTEEQRLLLEANPERFVDFDIPWTLNINYSLNLNRNFDTELQADTNAISQSILFNGDFTVLKRWKIGFNSGYDLVQKDFTTTSIDLYWDLHCWEFTCSWVPFGIRKSISMQLNIKSSMLKDLKLQRRYGADGIFR